MNKGGGGWSLDRGGRERDKSDSQEGRKEEQGVTSMLLHFIWFQDIS